MARPRTNNPFERRRDPGRDAQSVNVPMFGQIGRAETALHTEDLAALAGAAYERGRLDETIAADERQRDAQRETWDRAWEAGYADGARMATSRAFTAIARLLNATTVTSELFEDRAAVRRTVKEKLVSILGEHLEQARRLHKQATGWMQDPEGQWSSQDDTDTAEDDGIPF